jgi:hypothetical protein
VARVPGMEVPDTRRATDCGDLTPQPSRLASVQQGAVRVLDPVDRNRRIFKQLQFKSHSIRLKRDSFKSQ